MKKYYLYCLTIFLFAAQSLRSQAVVSGIVDSATVAVFTPGSGSSTNTISATTLPSFSYNFSTNPGTDTIQVTWSAPVGKRFEIAAPSGFEPIGVYAYLSGGNSTSGSFSSYSGISVQFIGLTGATYVTTGTGGIFDNMADPLYGASAGAGLIPGGNVSFTGIQFTATVSSGVNGSFNSTVGDFYIQASALGGGASPDPGVWFSLQDVSAAPVPEPSTYAAVAGGAALGLAAWKRRRRAAVGV